MDGRNVKSILSDLIARTMPSTAIASGIVSEVSRDQLVRECAKDKVG